MSEWVDVIKIIKWNSTLTRLHIYTSTCALAHYELLTEFKVEKEQTKKSNGIKILESLDGIMSVGGDAMIDTEKLYE